MIISKKLRGLREDAGILQKDVAKVLGITRVTYTNYELGTREPSLHMVVKLFDFYKVSADYLLGREDWD